VSSNEKVKAEIFFEALCSRELRRDLFCGTITREERMQRLREYVTKRHLADSFAHRESGISYTWAEAFGRVYGESLVQHLKG
jgi:hypothetical protein